VLKAITELNLSALERAESLEQLRWMENGFAIKVVITDVETMCVDTPEDLERARKVLLTN
jgi:3-deoxy-manno-octulosonate cytidylyltransferase (CMP-KDO synthetase)